MNETFGESTSGQKGTPAKEPAKTPVKRRRMWRAWLVYFVMLVLVAECGARVSWMLIANVPFWSMSQIWYKFHPEIRKCGLDHTVVRNDDETLDVLLLGGSVVHADFGSIQQLIESNLQRSTGRPVKVYNLGNVARNSRDSMLKYESLAANRFDLVLVADGINEVRMNNCLPGMFRDDYAHCSWYFQLNRFLTHKEAPYFVLPYSIEFAAADILDAIGIDWFVPRHEPNKDWMQYGKFVCTERPFRNNLERMIDIANQRGEKLALFTVANFLPEDYSREAFRRKTLDYGKYTAPIELWGTPDSVRRGVAVHNRVIRELAAEHPEVVLIDVEGKIPHDANHFDDCCHLADAGCQIFVSQLIDALPVQQLSAAPGAAKPK